MSNESTLPVGSLPGLWVSAPAAGWTAYVVCGWLSLCLLMSLAVPAAAGQQVPATSAPQPARHVPMPRWINSIARGAYWPWGRTESNAQKGGLDEWVYADRLLGKLAEHHFNMVWVAHMPASDLPRLCRLADRHGIGLMASVDLRRELPNFGPPAIDEAIARLSESWRECPALWGYVGFDEPKGREMQVINLLGEAVRRHDPERPLAVVVRPHEMPTAAAELNLPLLTMDAYRFFFAGVPWTADLPPGRTAQLQYRDDVESAARLVSVRGKTLWIMPQVFMETWGRGLYEDPDTSQLMLDKGGYGNWRMPTLAETRWQLWAALLAGAKGVVPFVLLPSVTEAEDKASYMADKGAGKIKPAKRSNIAEPTPVGRDMAIVRPGTVSSPYLDELGRVYGQMAKLDALLASAEPARALAAARPPLRVAAFRLRGPSRQLLLVVNDNLSKVVTGEVTVPGCMRFDRTEAADMPPATRADGLQHLSVTLEPGAAAVLTAHASSLGCGEVLAQLDPEWPPAADDVPWRGGSVEVVRDVGHWSQAYLSGVDGAAGTFDWWLHPKVAKAAAGGRLLLVADAHKGYWPEAVEPIIAAGASPAATRPIKPAGFGVYPLAAGDRVIRVHLAKDQRLRGLSVVFEPDGDAPQRPSAH